MHTIFLSKILGLYFIIIGSSYLINFNYCKKVIHEITRSYGITSICGSSSILLGLLIILNYNIWDNYHQIIISLISWAFLLLGFIFIFIPKSVQHAGKKLLKNRNSTWLSLLILILGIFLTFLGYLKK